MFAKLNRIHLLDPLIRSWMVIGAPPLRLGGTPSPHLFILSIRAIRSFLRAGSRAVAIDRERLISPEDVTSCDILMIALHTPCIRLAQPSRTAA